ncbi:twin-arginine translocase TatA/TatE family subunit [Streptomyces sp. NPDC014991]|uniref:twin-arginine translocase TatA/TatE family subunit n=1 Tax=Streptomyces sp. NPDC014991 TaxID=3364935 RepID=UPI0036FBA2A1
MFEAKRLPDTARTLGRSLRIPKVKTRANREKAAQEASSTSAEPPELTKAQGPSRPGTVAAEPTKKGRGALHSQTWACTVGVPDEPQRRQRGARR